MGNLLNYLGAICAVVILVYFLYDRHFRKSHRIDVSNRQIGFVEMLSLTDSRNKKPLLMICGLKIVNSGTSTITLKDIELNYFSGGKMLTATPFRVRTTGSLNGRPILPLTNTKDFLMIAWDCIRDKIVEHEPLLPGAIMSGEAMFVLKIPAEDVEKLVSTSLVVRDYQNRVSVLTIKVEERWENDKNLLYIDAPIKKGADVPEWEGVAIAVRVTEDNKLDFKLVKTS